MAKIRVENAKPLIGSKVYVDKSALCDDDVVEQCRALIEERGVIVFPGLKVTDAEQIAFTNRLGTPLDFTKEKPRSNASEGIYEISLDPTINNDPRYVLGTFFWHMDGILVEGAPPPKYTLLAAHRLSAKGGQTEFASTKLGYERLPEAMKAEIANLRIVHNLHAAVHGIMELGEKWDGPALTSIHPLVWERSTGVKSLVIGYTADSVVGMPLAEGRALLARLLEWTAQPDFTYRHEWGEGDFVVWDNCGTLHRVIPYDPASGRNMHRTSVGGTEMVK